MGERMYYVLKIIQEEKGKSITGKEILKRLEEYDIYLDIKTVYALIKRINEFFKVWLSKEMIVSKRKSGFTIENEYFNDGELQFLCDGISFHEDLDDEDKKDLKEKLFLLSSFHQQERIVSFPAKEKKTSFSLFTNLSTIMKAIDNQQVLSFEYITYIVSHHRLKESPTKENNKKKQYYISPYQIISHNNHYYLIGYNEKNKNELSTYRIDRMRLIQTIRSPFIEMREQFDMLDEIDKMTNMYLSKTRDTLVLECQHQVLREIASHFKTALKAEKLYQDKYLITLEDTPISEGLIGWIMMLQSQIKVISPYSLQKEIKKRIEDMAYQYKDVL